MKRISALIVIFSFTMLLVSCGKADEAEKDYSNFTHLQTLNYTSFQEKITDGDEFLIYIGHKDCGDSQLFNQQFETLFVDEIGVLMVEFDNFYYFDISEIIESLSDSDARSDYRDLYGFYSTPSLVSYKDIDDDGRSDIENIAEWRVGEGFYMRDYMQWFYDNGVLNANPNVVHEGPSERN